MEVLFSGTDTSTYNNYHTSPPRLPCGVDLVLCVAPACCIVSDLDQALVHNLGLFLVRSPPCTQPSRRQNVLSSLVSWWREWHSHYAASVHATSETSCAWQEECSCLADWAHRGARLQKTNTGLGVIVTRRNYMGIWWWSVCVCVCVCVCARASELNGNLPLICWCSFLEVMRRLAVLCSCMSLHNAFCITELASPKIVRFVAGLLDLSMHTTWTKKI